MQRNIVIALIIIILFLLLMVVGLLLWWAQNGFPSRGARSISSDEEEG